MQREPAGPRPCGRTWDSGPVWWTMAGADRWPAYPTLPPATLAPRLPTLESLPLGSEPSRVVARDGVLRPNGAALYRLEDVRGYESIVLDRFADTYPLWSRPQP